MTNMTPKQALSPSFALDAAHDLQQPNQRAAIAPNDASGNSSGSAQPAMTGRTFVPFAALSSTPTGQSEQPAIALMDVKQSPKNDASDSSEQQQPGRNASVPPLNRGFAVPPQIGECAHCGAPLYRKQRGGRLPKYCSAQCRVAAYRDRNRKQAGGGAS